MSAYGGPLRTARQAWADFVRADLELGFTLLGMAAVTGEGQRARKCVRNAIATLRTADVFLADGRPGEGQDEQDIRRRGDQLRTRLRTLAAHGLADQAQIGRIASVPSVRLQSVDL